MLNRDLTTHPKGESGAVRILRGALPAMGSAVAGALVTMWALGAAGAVALAIAAVLCVVAVLAVVRRAGMQNMPDHDTGDATEDLGGTLGQSALEAESAGRKLGAQVGETLEATARIASRTVAAGGRVAGLSQSVSEGASAMEEILAAVESLARQIEKQNELVEQSASAMEQMSASIESVSAVAGSKRVRADNLSEMTDLGRTRVESTERILDQAAETVGTVHDIISIIDDIAARTNVLAINAAIEAARAGTAGRGFAVVAGEVRGLAEGTASHAARISATLRELSATIGEARAAGKDTRAAFDGMHAGALEVSEAFAEITASTAELAIGAREVVQATDALRMIAQENLGSATEMKSGAGEVTHVIGAARDTARDTAEAMASISSSAGNVTEAVHRICRLSIEANNRTREQLRNVARLPGSDERAMSEARQRLELANTILEHLSWVGEARGSIDGRIPADDARERLLDSSRSSLGQWLATDGKRIVPDPERYRELVDLHTRLHGTLASILDCGSDQTGCVDVEDLFAELLALSRRIVERLTSYQGGRFVEWSREFATNVELFDAHHRRLFGLVDRLAQAMTAGEGSARLAEVFDELLAYTDYHFNAEEAAFERFDYPGCETQKTQHRELVTAATKLRQDMESGKAMVTVEVMEFLRDWLTRHIKGCDRLYAEFFADKDLDRWFGDREQQNRVRSLVAASQ